MSRTANALFKTATTRPPATATSLSSRRTSSPEGKGKVQEVFAPAGLRDLFDSEYVVRAVGVNPTGQLGWSNLSGSSRAKSARQDMTRQVETALSNITFGAGVTPFDGKLSNARGAFSADKTLYTPVEFEIVSVSNAGVTVRNADGGANTFAFNQTLPLGATSAARQIEFNNPLSQLFTFDARVYANAFAGSTTLSSGTTKVAVPDAGAGNDPAHFARPPEYAASLFKKSLF